MDSDGVRGASWVLLVAGLILLVVPVLLGPQLCPAPPCSSALCHVGVCLSVASSVIWGLGILSVVLFSGMREWAYRLELAETEVGVVHAWGPRTP
jgi:hypothetical protein